MVPFVAGYALAAKVNVRTVVGARFVFVQRYVSVETALPRGAPGVWSVSAGGPVCVVVEPWRQ